MLKLSKFARVIFSLLVLASMLLSACQQAATSAPKAEPTKAPEATKAPEPTKAAEPTKAPEPTKEEPKPTEPPAEEAPVEIVYYFPGGAQKDTQMVQDAMNEILKTKINATIKLVQLDWGAYNDKMNLMFSSGEACDIVFTAPWINNYFQLVNNESLLALDELLPKYAPQLWADIKPEFWNAVRVSGKVYAVPNQQIWVKPWGFAARKDMAEKYNFDWQAVTKWDELDPFLEQIKQGEPDVIPWSGRPGFRHEIYGWDPLDDGIGASDISILGVNALNTDYKVFNVLETPEFKGFVDTMYRWYQAGYLPKEADPDATASWKAGKYVLWSHLIDPRTWEWEKRNKGYEFIGKPLTDPVIMTTASVIATLNGVCSSSKNPEKAVQYLNLINTDPELYNLMNYGIEGKHWVWLDEAKQLIGLPEGVASWPETGYYPDTLWMYGSNFLAYYTSAPDAENKLWDQIKDLNNSSTASAAMGFTFDRSSVQTEIANVNAAATEFCLPLIDGTISSDEGLQACIDKVKEAGVDKIIAAMQTQLDAFKATKK